MGLRKPEWNTFLFFVNEKKNNSAVQICGSIFVCVCVFLVKYWIDAESWMKSAVLKELAFMIKCRAGIHFERTVRDSPIQTSLSPLVREIDWHATNTRVLIISLVTWDISCLHRIKKYTSFYVMPHYHVKSKLYYSIPLCLSTCNVFPCTAFYLALIPGFGTVLPLVNIVWIVFWICLLITTLNCALMLSLE